MSANVSVTVSKVDHYLLRKQRDWLLELVASSTVAPPEADGLINLLDAMLDQAADKAAKPIRKVYSYGDSAGEEMLSLEEFAVMHIQDWDVAFRCADRLLRSGEDTNNDEHEQVFETYTVADRAELINQLRGVGNADLEAAGFDLALLENAGN